MPSTDRIKELQVAAARVACELLPGSAVRRLILVGERGEKIADLPVPPCPDAGSPVQAPETPAIVSGWSFTDRHALYDGKILSLAGRKLDVLRVLVARETATVDDLRDAWQGSVVEESSVRWQVAELRKALKSIFADFPGDPIASAGNGYSLQIR